jgi:hypothetical protein
MPQRGPKCAGRIRRSRRVEIHREWLNPRALQSLVAKQQRTGKRKVHLKSAGVLEFPRCGPRVKSRGEKSPRLLCVDAPALIRYSNSVRC